MLGHDRKARRARLRLAGIAVVTVAALTGAGVLIAQGLGGHSAQAHAAPSASAVASAPSSSQSAQPMTPARARPVRLDKPTGQKDGSSTGFPHNGLGALSAAVYHMDEYAFLDDEMARRQLTAITASDSPTDAIDKAVSDVRALREAVGLASSGGMPAGLTFSTSVDAVRARSLTADGNVVQVWMHYNRTAVLPNGNADTSPLRDQTTDVIVEWQNGDWKQTTNPIYVAKRTFPAAYDPNSPVASADGWWPVIRED
jgi:hypothetical protein